MVFHENIFPFATMDEESQIDGGILMQNNGILVDDDALVNVSAQNSLADAAQAHKRGECGVMSAHE